MADEAVEESVDVGTRGPDVGSQRRPDGGRGSFGQFGAEREDRPADVVGPQRIDRLAARRRGIDHDCGQGIGRSGLERSLPPVVDLDEVEQRSDDAGDAVQTVGAGLRPSLLEGEFEGVGAGDPAVGFGLGLSSSLFGCLGRSRRGCDRCLGLGLRRDQRCLGGIGVGEDGPQALGFGAEPLVLARERREPGSGSLEFLFGSLDPVAQGPEFAADLRGLAGRGGRTVGPLRLERLSGLVERCFALGEPFEVGDERCSAVLGGGQLGGEACRLGLERRDHGGVDGHAALSLDASTTLGEHRHQPARSLAESFVASERVAEVVAADGGQFGLGLHHRGVELAESLAQLGLGVGVGGAFGDDATHALLERVELASGEEDPQAAEFGDQGAVATSRVGLALERPELAADLTEQVLEPGEVGLGGGEAALGLLLALAVLEDPGRFLDDQAPLLGAGIEHGVDLALTHDDVLLTPDAGIGQQVGDVEQPARHPVDRVLAVAGAEQRAADGDLGEVDGEQPRRVVDGEGHLGPAERLTLRRPGEDDVVHLLTADRLGRLGPEDPTDGVDDVGLPRPVRADDDRDAGLEVEHGRLGERLEPLEGE